MSIISGLLGLDAGKATKKAANRNIEQYQGYYDKGNTAINESLRETTDALKTASSLYDPYADTGKSALSMYSNALGLNGADGNAAAVDAYRTSPGYEFALDQGTQAALRGASAGGSLTSGNTLTALAQYGQGLANQNYNSWLDRLNGVSTTGLSAVNGQAAQQDALASAYQAAGNNRLGVLGNYTSGITGAINQNAQGQEAGAGALAGLGSGIFSGISKLAGLF